MALSRIAYEPSELRFVVVRGVSRGIGILDCARMGRFWGGDFVPDFYYCISHSVADGEMFSVRFCGDEHKQLKVKVLQRFDENSKHAYRRRTHVVDLISSHDELRFSSCMKADDASICAIIKGHSYVGMGNAVVRCVCVCLSVCQRSDDSFRTK